MSAVNPQQGLTEDVLAGFSGVVGSNDRYGEIQLKIMNGGGLWILYQEEGEQTVRTRWQVTSDMTTVERRENSVTRVVDFASKTVRAALRSFVGTVNVTTAVQDAINSTLDGIGAFLVRLGVLTSFSVDAIRQSTSSPDTIEVDVTIGVPIPLNFVKVTLII
jgi:hypothetical protein